MRTTMNFDQVCAPTRWSVESYAPFLDNSTVSVYHDAQDSRQC